MAPKTANRKLHFFVPFNFESVVFLSMFQLFTKSKITST